MLNFVLLLALAGVHRVNLKAAVESLLGCAFLLQGWFVLRFITVGGVLWQVAVFAYGYAMFPFVIQRVSSWTDRSLYGGFLLLWLFSLGLWALVFFMPPEQRLQGWWIWHVHCLSRLPHVIAGVLLGELVERKRQQQPTIGYHGWAFWTDVFSLVLVLTAIQAPIVQWYYGTDSRSVVSIALQAVLLPLHAAWLAGMVLAYKSSAACWTRMILSLRPLVALGDVSLVLYCLHLVLVFCYISLYHFLETGQWQIMLDGYALTVQIPWVHMPIQWVLVVAVSFAVSKFFESPMRKILTPARDSPMSTTSTTEASSLLSSDHQDSYDATKSAN